jgi:dolichol kinase
MSRPQEGAQVIVRPIYFAVGIIVALLLFPPAIAYASIIILAVGDPVAAFVGERVGRVQVRRKTLEGSAAGLTASFLLASIIVSPLTALIGSAGGMLMEFLDEPDDNLTMPIVAGALMMLVRVVHLTN